MADEWKVAYSRRALKDSKKLPGNVLLALSRLFKELETLGPIRKNWPNFSSLNEKVYHCHLKKGRPTYVACWSIESKKIKFIEVYYVGTHENAPY